MLAKTKKPGLEERLEWSSKNKKGNISHRDSYFATLGKPLL